MRSRPRIKKEEMDLRTRIQLVPSVKEQQLSETFYTLYSLLLVNVIVDVPVWAV